MVESKTKNLEDSKEKILSFLRTNGPSIPIKLSTLLGVDTMLASAFLADLLSDKEIKISKMKVGNSPIYFLEGQEEKLQDFSKYLGGKEREAFELLKEKKILRDRNQDPPIRVALRSIKDFAHGFNVRDELFWRFYLVDQDEAVGKVSEKIEKPKIPVMEKIKQAFIGEEKKIIPEENIQEVKKEEIIEKQIKEEPQEIIQVPVPKVIEKEISLGQRIEELLKGENFQIVRKIQERKRDYSAIVRIRNDSEIKDYLCISKDKKMITEADILKFIENGKKDKLPVLIVSTGELNKKAQEWVDYLKGTLSYKFLR